MDSVIVGQGLVSPLGLGATEHALFVRASVGAPPPPAFETEGGKRVRANHCGFLGAFGGSAGHTGIALKTTGAELEIAERLFRMVEIATHQALTPWEAAFGAGSFTAGSRVGGSFAAGSPVGGSSSTGSPVGGPLALAFVAPRRAGITSEAVAETCSRVAKHCQASLVQTWHDAAGAFDALKQASAWLSGGEAAAVLIAGVDSFAHPEALEEDLASAESAFCPSRPPPSEGAAAILVTRDDVCRAYALEGARVLECGTSMGHGNDDDDVILDGVAMTSLLRALPERQIEFVAGQEKVDDLRARDWAIASARMARRFAGELHAINLENETGRLGAAAGVASLSFGVAALRHGIYRALSPTAHFVVWAISRDGTRGLSLLQGGARKSVRENRVLVAAHTEPGLRTVEREAFQVSDESSTTEDEAAVPERELDALPLVPPLDVLSASNDTESDPPSPLLPPKGTALSQGPGPRADRPSSPPKTSVHLASGKGAPLPLVATYAEVVTACLDGIALAARHRALLPRDGRAREEERILAFLDALVVVPRFPSLLIAWWEEASTLPDPWKVWAPTFALACLDGQDVPEALARLWRRLPEDDAEAVAVAGEALVLGAHPNRGAWARRLSADAHPAVRAAALEALSLSGALEPDEVVRVLTLDEARSVRWVAVRAAARLPEDRLPEDRRLDDLLRGELNKASDGDLVWNAARALALRGNPSGYFALRYNPSVLQRLGAYVLDVLAFLGDASDASIARQVVARLGLTSKVLRGLGRYGHTGAAPMLVRALGDEDAAEDASAALVWLFGVPFEEEKITSPDAWRAWLREAPLDEATRYRFGSPYRPGCVAEAAADGSRSQADLVWLVDEANVRAGLAERPALFRWSPEADAALAHALRVLSRKDADFARDTWKDTWRADVRLRGRGP